MCDGARLRFFRRARSGDDCRIEHDGDRVQRHVHLGRSAGAHHDAPAFHLAVANAAHQDGVRTGRNRKPILAEVVRHRPAGRSAGPGESLHRGADHGPASIRVSHSSADGAALGGGAPGRESQCRTSEYERSAKRHDHHAPRRMRWGGLHEAIRRAVQRRNGDENEVARQFRQGRKSLLRAEFLDHQPNAPTNAHTVRFEGRVMTYATLRMVAAKRRRARHRRARPYYAACAVLPFARMTSR